MHFLFVLADGKIIMKTIGDKTADDINESTNKENININNINRSNNVIIGSMEEILISAVQDRPPLWNFKNTLPSQRTQAARNKLWEEIAYLINTNTENSIK